MKRLLAITLFLSVGALAVASPEGLARKAITRQYEAIAKTFVASDFDRLATFMTDDFVAKAPNSHDLNRAQVVDDFRGQRRMLDEIKWTKKLRQLELHGDLCRVHVEGRMTGTLKGGKDKPHHFLLNANTDDVWVRSTDKWLLKSSNTTAMQFLIDGKPITMH